MWTIVHNGIVRKGITNAVKFYNIHSEEPMTIYKDGELILDYTPSDYCGCGRSYDDNPSGKVFKFKNDLLQHDQVKILQTPVVCMICYYENELAAGRWAPKYIKNKEYL